MKINPDRQIASLEKVANIQQISHILESCQPSLCEAILRRLQNLIREQPRWQLDQHRLFPIESRQ